MKLIDKNALVAEINKRIIDAPVNNIGHQRVWAYNDVKDIINTLEVEEVQEEPVDKCKGCNNVKGCITCVDGDQWAHYEESESEDLEEACKQLAENARKHKAETSSPFFCQTDYKQGVIDGAKWQKNNLWKPADGDDLPEYNREVIAILDYDFGHYKVVYAHRPNPNGWNGTNIDTEEKKHFEPEIYDKGGWNQPHVLYWLDAKLPYEENKIIK